VARVEKSALVMFSDQRMFDLVSDVGSYKNFLPWCADSEVISQEGNELCGRIDVERLGIRQSFTTCNHCDAPSRMTLRLKDGPFSKLDGEWRFEALNDSACKVILVLEFEFAGKLISAAFGKVFEQIANTMVESFVARAKEVYTD